MKMEIKVVLSDNEDSQRYELAALRDMYTNISDLEGIYNIARNALKHDGNLEQALEEIKAIAYRNYSE